MRDAIIIVVALIIVGVAAFGHLNDDRACKAAHGVLVRAPFGYECVQEAR